MAIKNKTCNVPIDHVTGEYTEKHQDHRCMFDANSNEECAIYFRFISGAIKEYQ